ncbi:hypothetical protein GCM10007921_02210 [Tritonibacter mobilis]|nr:hypothetical protein GCM10007921_02210 [Tritonibacter mobilis]
MLKTDASIVCCVTSTPALKFPWSGLRLLAVMSILGETQDNAIGCFCSKVVGGTDR